MAIKSKEKSQKLVQKYSSKYWFAEITQREDAHKKFFDRFGESIKVYSGEYDFKNEGFRNIQRRINCWWYVVNTLIPAYYSSTPKCEVGLRKRAGSEIFELASVGLERNVQYSMDEDFDFSYVGFNAALHYLLGGRSVLWARFDAEIEQSEGRFALIPGEGGKFTDVEGQPYEGDTEEEDGITYGSMPKETVNAERAVLDLVQPTDYLQSDGRDDSEVTWKAKRAWLSEDEATEIFGAQTAKKLTYDSYPESLKREYQKFQQNYDGKAEMWEIYCEESGKMYWLQKKGEKSIVESGTPEIKFDDFYPCVVINANPLPDTCIPVSDYWHCRDQIIEVERLTTRKHAIIEAIRTNFAYDATMSELENLLIGDLKGIPVKSWPAYKSRGGLAAGMEFLDVKPFVDALGVITQEREAALDKLCEMMKCSDLLRGISEPTKTATANRLESQWSSLGLVVRQNQFAEFIGKAVGKLGAIIAQKISDERILDVSDADELLTPLLPQVQDPMQGQMMLEQAKQQMLQVIRDNTERNYHIKIATDSMVALDERQERQDGVDLMQSTGSFFQQMGQIIEQYPTMLPFATELMKNVVRRYRGGKELEGLFTKALEDQSAQVEQKMQDAQNQPQDPKLIEAQARLQIAQQDSQTKQMVAQLESQDRHQANLAEVQKMTIEAQIEKQKQELEAWKTQQDVALKQEELKIKANEVNVELLKVQATTDVQMANQEIAKEQTRLAAIIDTQKLEIERQKTKHELLLGALEEERKRREHLDNHIANLAQIAATSAPGEAPQKIREGLSKTPTKPKEESKPKMRIHKIITDASGMPTELHSTEVSIDEHASRSQKKGSSL